MSTYQRGMKTLKATSASLVGGETLLTIDGGNGLALVAQTKTGAILRTVESVQTVAPGPYERTRRYLITFTDGTKSMGYAPSQTWAKVDALGLALAAEDTPEGSVAVDLEIPSEAADDFIQAPLADEVVEIAPDTTAWDDLFDRIRDEVAELEEDEVLVAEVGSLTAEDDTDDTDD